MTSTVCCYCTTYGGKFTVLEKMVICTFDYNPLYKIFTSLKAFITGLKIVTKSFGLHSHNSQNIPSLISLDLVPCSKLPKKFNVRQIVS